MKMDTDICVCLNNLFILARFIRATTYLCKSKDNKSAMFIKKAVLKSITCLLKWFSAGQSWVAHCWKEKTFPYASIYEKFGLHSFFKNIQ